MKSTIFSQVQLFRKLKYSSTVPQNCSVQYLSKCISVYLLVDQITCGHQVVDTVDDSGKSLLKDQIEPQEHQCRIPKWCAQRCEMTIMFHYESSSLVTVFVVISTNLHLHECIKTKLENTLDTVKDPPLLDKACFIV